MAQTPKGFKGPEKELTSYTKASYTPGKFAEFLNQYRQNLCNHSLRKTLRTLNNGRRSDLNFEAQKRARKKLVGADKGSRRSAAAA